MHTIIKSRYIILINFVNKYDFEFKLKTTSLAELAAAETTVQCRVSSGETRRSLLVSLHSVVTTVCGMMPTMSGIAMVTVSAAIEGARWKSRVRQTESDSAIIHMAGRKILDATLDTLKSPG